MSFDGQGVNVTSEGRQQGWVLIATSWDSKFGDPPWKLGQRLGGRKRDGDAVEGSNDDDDGDSERDLIKVGSMLMGFGRG